MRIFSATALAWSISSTRTPRWPAIAAQCKPAAPAPTITASTSRIGAIIGVAAEGSGDALSSYTRMRVRPIVAVRAAPQTGADPREPAMWTVNVILPFGLRFIITPRGLLVAWAVLAVAILLGLYVLLLQQSVQRGEQLRAEQRRLATQPSEKTVPYATFSRATTKP